MNGYLLLRDNKQTGPYSKDEMIAKGFKPYDLIWAEGKSAGWRYPGELPEFTAFAPMVEEQPFDRFFKKPSSSASNSQVPATDAASPKRKEVLENAIAEQSPATPKRKEVLENAIVEQSPATPRRKEALETTIAEQAPAKVISIQSRKIFVTLPGNSTTPKPLPTATKPVAAEEIVSIPAPSKEKTVVIEKEKQTTEKSPLPVTQQPAYTSFQQTNQFMQDRLQPKAREEMLFDSAGTKKKSSNSLLKGALAACLLLTGIIIGLMISNTRQSTEQQQLNSLVKQIQDREVAKKGGIVDQPVSLPPQQPVNNQVPDPLPGKQAAQKSEKEIIKQVNNKNEIISPDKNETSKVVPVVQTDKTAEAKMDTKEIIPSNKNEEITESTRRNIYSLVSVEGSSFKTGVLGGISNLHLTVSNNSLYPIDQVEVQVNYMNIEKRVVKKETIVINDVAAGEQKTIPVPKSNRGVSVSYSIIKINSRALGLAQTRL